MAEADGDMPQGVMNVAKEDQEKINRFAKLNARLEDIKDELTSQTNELKNYEDAVSEVDVKVLEDEADNLHIKVGDIIANLEPDKIQKWLEAKLDVHKATVKELETKKEEVISEMNELKAHLYARFGNNIHLESGP